VGHYLAPGLVELAQPSGHGNAAGTTGALTRTVTSRSAVTVARLARAHRWTRWGGGCGTSTGAARGRHRARYSVAGLTRPGGDAEVEEELRPSGAPMATTASGGLQRPGGDPTAPVMEREVRSGPKRGKRGSRTVLTMA
jgi:hypothetical protein